MDRIQLASREVQPGPGEVQLGQGEVQPGPGEVQLGQGEEFALKRTVQATTAARPLGPESQVFAREFCASDSLSQGTDGPLPPSGQNCSLLEILPAVYDELRRLARSKLAGELPGQTLQTTALVHEAFAKVSGYHGGQWRSERDFVAAAAQAMRQILVDRARAKLTLRRGGGLGRSSNLQLDQHPETELEPLPEVMLVDRALEQLELADPEKAILVKLKYFAGLSLDEAAAAIGISRSTAYRQWNCARIILKQLIEHNLRA